jgi:HlyD family secretion protein
VFSFNAREELLQGLTVGSEVRVARAAHAPTRGVVTGISPLGSFATWQAERAVGAHDRNTLRLRVDPQEDRGDVTTFDAGTTIWIER